MKKSEIKAILLEELEKEGLTSSVVHNMSAQGGEVSSRELDEELLQENPAVIAAVMGALKNPQVQQMLIAMIMPMLAKATGTAPPDSGAEPATGTVSATPDMT
tara:strand:+ start:759 stop:1067 length:309 start_codon:yes stop_codon:yes gene_type:complete